MTKKSYEKPTLTLHGDIESLTKGMSSGPVTDATFPAGTPRGDVTFS